MQSSVFYAYWNTKGLQWYYETRTMRILMQIARILLIEKEAGKGKQAKVSRTLLE